MRPWMVVLLLAVAVLVALSIVGLSVSGGGRPDFEGPKGLPRVTGSEISTKGDGCPARFLGTCEVTIAPAGRWLRRLQLSTIDQVVVQFTPGSVDRPVPIKLTGSFKNKEVDLIIDRQGARLELRCVASHPVKTPPGCGVTFQ